MAVKNANELPMFSGLDRLEETIAYIEQSPNVTVIMDRTEALRLLYMQRDFMGYVAANTASVRRLESLDSVPSGTPLFPVTPGKVI